VSFTKQPDPKSAENYAEDVAVTPLAIPIIAGPGAITTVIVLTGDSAELGWPAIAIVVAAIFVVIYVVYYAMGHSYIIAGGIREKEFKVVNRVLGLLLLAIGYSSSSLASCSVLARCRVTRCLDTERLEKNKMPPFWEITPKIT